jgi:hypothetical protein
MASGRVMRLTIGALCLALTAASPSFAQSAGAAAQSGPVVFWNAAQCVGGYQSNVYTVHCEPGPFTTILDFQTKMQFFCVNNEAVDVRWENTAGANRGPPLPPSQIAWRPECWKKPLGLDVDPNAAILSPPYSQTPPPNNYMTINVIVVYDPAKPTIKACLVPLFPRFSVQPACGDAEIRS